MRTVILALLMSLMTAIALFTSFENNVPLAVEGSVEDEVSKWIEWAEIAWSYYDPGIGVDPKTGIPRAGYRWPYLTDWDLGGYIVAIVKAELMGILSSEGEWGANDRIEKVLKFLETRPLSPYGIPYRLYCATSGEPHGRAVTNVSDAGRLLIALALLKRHRPDLAARIDAIVERNNYKHFVNDTSAWRTTAGFYKYYVAHGFKLFKLDNGYPVQQALREFERIKNGPHIKVFEIDLPITEVTSEPLLHAVFELNVSDDFMDYVKRAYIVQEKRYYATGKYTAWSEGNTDLRSPTYVYEWIVTPKGDTWKITPREITPIVYTKVAFGYHALYNTEYTRSLLNYLINKNNEARNFMPYALFLPPKGFIEGVDESGRIVGELIDKTQVMIIEAAYYALRKRVLESADILINMPLSDINHGEPLMLNLTYVDPTPLKHICKYNVIIHGMNIPWDIQYEFYEECHVSLRWMPPGDGSYRIRIRAIADYVLFNKTIEKTFVVRVGSAQPTSEQVIRDAKIVSVESPSWVVLGEEFSLKVSVFHDFGNDTLPLKVVVKDEIKEEAIAESRVANVSGNGTIAFMIVIKAPNSEGILSLTLVPVYNEGDIWVELIDGAMSIEIEVLSEPISERVIIRREIVYATVTRSLVVERVSIMTYTVTRELYGETSLPFVVVIVCSVFLFSVAVLAMVLRFRQLIGPIERRVKGT